MDFSAFVNILFGYRKPYDDGRYPGQAEFIKILFDALIPDDVYERGILNTNPIYGYKKRMLEYIFTGDRHIDPNIAATIKRVMDLPTFEGYFDDFSEDGLISLSGDINEYGFDTTSTDVIKAAGSIMAQLVEHIADGKPEEVVVLDYKAREKGRRHVKDIVPATLEYRDGKFDIKGELITVDMSKYPEEEADQTLRYVQALYEAYESRLKRKIDASNVNTILFAMGSNQKPFADKTGYDKVVLKIGTAGGDISFSREYNSNQIEVVSWNADIESGKYSTRYNAAKPPVNDIWLHLIGIDEQPMLASNADAVKKRMTWKNT